MAEPWGPRARALFRLRSLPRVPETVAALRTVLARRKSAKDDADSGLVFVTSRGGNWSKETGGNYLSWKFGIVCKRLGINGRKGVSFYGLRHSHRTIADEAKDQPAADYIMGHESGHMSTVYRERISDERLKAVEKSLSLHKDVESPLP